MKITSYAVARPAYYDRNAVATYSTYNAGSITPHTYTARWTYTVAAGKKAIMEFATILISTQTVASVNGSREGYLRVTSPSSATLLYLVHTSNTASSLGFIVYPTQPTFYAADAITGNTFDNSTGGTVYFDINGKFTAYDS